MSGQSGKRGAFAAAAILLFLIAEGAAASIGTGATINVNTPNDEYGTVLNQCSVREAVQTANDNADFGGCTHTGIFATGANSDVINLPAANPGYALARTGAEEDNNVQGDLDIRSNITIQGAGAGTTPIFVCAGCADRVVDVISGTNVAIKDVTLKLGHPNGSGGGMFVVAGSVVTLTRVTIGLNTTNAEGGGIFNQGFLTIEDSAIGNNKTLSADFGGGGIFNDFGASLTLNDSRVLDNRTEGDGANGSGAGIYNEGTLTLDNTTVDGNVIAIKGIVDFPTVKRVIGNGGGIYTTGPTTIANSTISNNVAAGNDAVGGGVDCTNLSSLGMSGSLVFNNRADPNPDVTADDTEGGGIFSQCDFLLVEDSVISSNSAESGGGIQARILDLRRSTVVGNAADEGGGISNRTGASPETSGLRHALTNSTIINNTATGDGGGLFYLRDPNAPNEVELSSVTIVGNTSNLGGVGGGNGGGLRVSFFDEQDLFVLRNSVLAGNSAAGNAAGEDCFVSDGALTSLGHNLIQSGDGGCPIAGAGDLAGVNAKLAAAANNGGPITGATSGDMAGMLTRAPLPDSPLVDAGDQTGCKDQGFTTLPTDQVGRDRAIDGNGDAVARCDIGAIELTFTVFADSYE